jgi:hypothetical protein
MHNPENMVWDWCLSQASVSRGVGKTSLGSEVNLGTKHLQEDAALHARKRASVSADRVGQGAHRAKPEGTPGCQPTCCWLSSPTNRSKKPARAWMCSQHVQQRVKPGRQSG